MTSDRRGYRGALFAVPWILVGAAVSIVPLRAAAARPEVRVGTGRVSGVAAAGVAGAPHAADIPFVFGNLATTPLPGMTDQRSRLTTADRRLSKLLMQYWLSFARRGDPNGPGRPHWSAFDLEGEPVMVIASKETAEHLHYRKAQLDWIESKLTRPAVW